MTEFITNSPAETVALAQRLAKGLVGGEIIAFRGGMGMGKTCFTRGLALGLGFSGQVSSPTFALVNEYIGGRLPLYHFDMWRIENWEDLYSSGFFDYADTDGVITAEWSENIEGALQNQNVISVNIERLSDMSRKITIDGGGF